VIWGNSAPNGSNLYSGTFMYSCTLPIQTGTGNIGSNPVFVADGVGDYRLAAGSPCIDRGTNQAWMTGARDLAGQVRVVDGNADGVVRVDMGAYEYQAASLAPMAPMAAMAAIEGTDTDGDGMSDAREALAGTDPTDLGSTLRVRAMVSAGGLVRIEWDSVAGRTYRLEQAPAVSGPFVPVAVGLVATPPVNACEVPAAKGGAVFYRVSVEGVTARTK
jgi:hypothetical protein